MKAVAREAFVRACALDVAVRKPGNVCWAASGHGMEAGQFLASAEAAAGPLFKPGQGVGARIEAAVAASWAAAGCNTNLGIVLLAAPVALAAERLPGHATAATLREAIAAVLAGLTVADARAAYRGIAQAKPGGLGRARSQDVNEPPSLDLRAAMALAAERDLIARHYRDGYGALFELLETVLPRGWMPGEAPVGMACDAATVGAVQSLYLRLLSRDPDSHIVRKHGLAVAQNVMRSAQAWCLALGDGVALDADADFLAWDADLKRRGVNPGTTADLTVTGLLLRGLAGSP
ncbi:Triphosphoribosyl-dephospho-CoA protein [Rubrivivax sp. A210]|uniref:triphosphoribosyl-dephospho-CoA synthase n=1 Tax=Rubrivivax sp. A210 TaxID=2772301 RepID=UPI00191B50EE|nr:triphosphoribosyl-dephospho-CoA synthase [Rubrivivax sp. A210]CAD5372169.1 Triphosphoribosyl-dephospho-CoA protein [Rubrivivax sp. A210]